MMHSAGAAEAHLAGSVEPVITRPVVAWQTPVACRKRFRDLAIGLAGSSSLERAVGTLLVVMLAG